MDFISNCQAFSACKTKEMNKTFSPAKNISSKHVDKVLLDLENCFPGTNKIIRAWVLYKYGNESHRESVIFT